MPGWLNCFRIGLGKKLTRWILRRLRAFLWENWKLPRTKVSNLKKLGLKHKYAVMLGNT
jgi:RNA-directed DNA polymerase